MDELNKAWISEFLLIFGAVNLGVAWTNLENTSPMPFISGIISIIIAVILKFQLGAYSRVN